MDLFCGELPDKITVCGEDFPIRTDFRVWVRFGQITEQSRSVKDFTVALPLVFVNKTLPASFDATLSELFRFYACGQTERRTKSGGSTKKVVSFTHDSALIYCAFMAQYHIDLMNENLHWWLFRALFDGLEEKNKICEIMSYRAADLSKIKDRKQKDFYRRMQRLYKLPDTRSLEEIEQENLNNLAKFF